MFECFEASPLSGAVIECEGSLLRTFPDHALSVALPTFDNAQFRSELAAKIGQLDAEVVNEMMPQSCKAGSSMAEIRDTAHPGLVSDMLMAILASLGQPVKAQKVCKRTRDDVLWKNCLLPWRRSPLWLAIRVTMQGTLLGALPIETATIQYKNFLLCLISRIALMALALGQPGEVCHVISVKIARRVYKLGVDTFGFVQDMALDACQRVQVEEGIQWESVQRVDANRATTTFISDFSRDTALSLDNSKTYLDAALAYAHSSSTPSLSFVPECQSLLGAHRGLPRLDTKVTNEELIFMLAECEQWIQQQLPVWMSKFDSTAPAAEDCTALADLAKTYWQNAERAYADSPEQLSIMLLTIAELWYTVDRLVARLIPLLLQYSPEIPIDLFCPLLLPKQQYMQRLHIIEEHIKNRHDRVAQRNPSIFSDPQNQSFAMFYYAMSDGHRDLRRQIEQKASTKKAAKQSEWQRGMQKYEQLKNEADRLDCEYYTAKYGIPKHRGTCKKCQRNGEARNMKITKYEWPLPPDESSCVAAIFELDCPASFVAWRNITWMLVHDIGRPDYVQGGSYADTLHGYSGLECYVQTRSSCVSLSSRTKSFEKTHYVQSFPLVFEDCYSNNALQYAMMDCEQHSWITDQQSQPSVQHKCVKQLPSGPYSNLQFAVDSTNHSQNQVIASQEICSPSLSLHEFTSFGSLRADGEKTQWLNIRRELAASNLSFNTEAVSTLFTQAAWQAGSRGDTVYRTSHLVLADQIFCQELLQNIQAILDSIEANWKSDYAMLLLINLVLRILSLTPNQDIVEIVLRLLRRMRSVTMKWTEALKTLLQDATDDAQVLKIQHRLLKAAMLCKMTFDVDTSYTLRMLHSTQDLNAWFFCCILVRDTVPGDMALLPTYIRGMYLQDLKLTHCIHIAARRLVIIDKNGGLDAALSKFWSGFQSASNSWQDSPEPNGRWLTTQTMATSGRVPQTIYFNVLDGELLVDGRPIGRLPREYLNSAIYRRIFKAQLLNVFSSDMQGMLYMTARKIYGYLVYFTIRDGKVAIIIRNDLQTLELVPHDTFEGDMPSAFVDDYVHWLDLSSHDIHFRPLLRPWDSDNTSWNLQYRPNTASTLCKGDTLLIDVRSATFTTTLDVFKSLETWKNTQMTLTAEGTLRVAFPRFDLHFFFNEQGHFQCHELCRIVDPDQSLGTMVGLRSRLILCGLGEYAGRFDRVLVIPQGIVSIRKSGAHVDVEVSSSSKKVRLFRYQIDATLRRLQGTSEVASTLYKAYLHALTTSLLPDPFTGNTGTEEALEILGQRSMRLTKPANEEILPLLTWISELTPRRKLYPKHLRVMQQVQWHPEMSSLAQHDDFVILAQQILDSGDQFLEFYPASKANKSLYAGRDTSLLARAKLRNASFRSSNFGGNVYGDRKDAQYNARDHISSTGRAARTFEVASLVRDWPRRFNVSGDLLRELKAMETISGFAGPFDSSRPLTELLKISFKASWAPLLELCRSCSEEHDKYRLLFLFSNMAYGQQISSISQLNTLLAFAFVPSLRAIGNPPPYDSFTLTKGIQLNYSEVRSTIEQHMESFTPSRTYVNATERVEDENAYEKKKKDQVSIVIDHYTYQWPCRIPSRPSAGQAGLLDIGRADFDIATLFAHWTRNGEFEAYINRAQGLLDVINEDRHVKTYTAADWQQSRSHIRIATSTALPSVPSLMSKVSPPLTLERNTMTTHINSERSKPNPRLQNLVNKIGTKCSNADQVSTRKQYSEELQASLAAFYEHNERISPSKLPCSLGEVVLDRDGWDRHVSDYSQNIFDALGPKDTASRAMEAGGLWPRLTMRSILSNLSTVSAPTFAIRWKDCLVAIGEAVTILQRARRIVLAGEREDVSSFCAELENVGRVGWEASQRPEWLLIEIENDLLIRPNQAQVALEMIEPSSSSNALMQLNMVSPCPGLCSCGAGLLILDYRAKENLQ